jgi:hypothetical protein
MALHFPELADQDQLRILRLLAVVALDPQFRAYLFERVPRAVHHH